MAEGPPRVGIVGAGAGAAALSHVLDGRTDAEVVVLEKSGGVGGRAATRRHGALTYDYGANYVKADDERVVDLLTSDIDAEGLVDIVEPVWTFDGDGRISPGRDADDHKWSYRDGLTQLAKRLFAGTDADVHRRRRVTRIVRDGPAWRLTDDRSERWGPFDALVLTPPAPQTADLLRDAEWSADQRTALASAAAAVPYRAIYSAVLHYHFELDRPYYALVNVDREHDVGWISREECKPGHVPDGETLLVVQASPGWSVANADADPDGAVDELARTTATVLDDARLREPRWSDHQFWRYALADGAVAQEPLQAAEEHGLYCVGDWVAGEARVHAALRSGLDTGDRLADAL